MKTRRNKAIRRKLTAIWILFCAALAVLGYLAEAWILMAAAVFYIVLFPLVWWALGDL